MPAPPGHSVERGCSHFRRGLAELYSGRAARARPWLLRAVAEGDAESVWAAQALVQSFLVAGAPGRGRLWLERRLEGEPGARAWALGYLSRRLGQVDEACDWQRRALRSPLTRLAAAAELGYLECRRGREREGLSLLATALAGFRRARDAWGEGLALGLRSTHALNAFGRFEAVRYLADDYEVARLP